jgi:hypothetical protein
MATSEFGKAFRAARNAGDKTFTFNGKSYTTKLKEETESSKPAAKTEDSNPKSYTEMYKNMPEGTSDAAKQAVIAGMSREKAPAPAVSDDDEAASYKSRASSYGGPKADSDSSFGESQRTTAARKDAANGMKRGGKAVKKMASGGMASSRGDGIAQKGKTKGRFC